MSIKIFFVFALLCVVNASVITNEIFDEDPETDVNHEERDCSLQYCQQWCHRLGYPGGECVNGRCQCGNFFSQEEAVPTPSSDVEESLSPHNCNNQECGDRCRRYGYTGGYCDNGHCRCTSNTDEAITEPSSDVEESLSPYNCNNQECGDRCRRYGYTGGYCDNGHCRCTSNTDEAVPELSSNDEESLEPHNCNNQECGDRCRRYGYTGGSCLNGHCRCDSNTDEAIPTPSSDVEESLSPHNCNNQECGDRCRRYGYTGGYCDNGHCRCTSNTNEAVPEPSSDGEESLAPHNCNNQECGDRCRRYGYTGGSCLNGHCRCDSNTDDEIARIVDSESDIEQIFSRRECHSQLCNYLCRKIKFSSGTCVNNHCKCKLFPREDEIARIVDSQSDIEQIFPRRECHSQLCNYLCRKIKFSSGTCVNNHCKCKFFPREEAVSEPNSHVEESLSPHNCNNQECGDRCRRYGYTGGYCDNGHCRCTSNTDEAVPEPSFDGEESLLPHNCNNQECGDSCRRYGYTGGYCDNGHCRCNSNTDAGVVDSDESVSRRDCNFRACNRHCRRLGYTGGGCSATGRCKCDKTAMTKEAVFETFEKSHDSLESHSCNTEECRQDCRRYGYNGGVCVNGHCRCNNDKMDGISEAVELLSDPTESVSQRRCSYRECTKSCRKRGYHSGSCASGFCRCRKFRAADEVSESVETPFYSSEFLSENGCHYQACDQECRGLGFSSGSCVRDKCICYSNTEISEISPAGAENKDSNPILKTGEDLPTPLPTSEVLPVSPPRACHTESCKDWCHRQNYAGGTCEGNTCICY